MPNFKNLLATPERDYLINNKKQKIPLTSLEGKVVGLYFSGHWCGPCRAFTPQLANIYLELKHHNKPFEIVFISSDRNEESFDAYHKEMPWLALPFSEQKLKQSLSIRYQVEGIPTLVLFDAEGKLLSLKGRQLVSQGAHMYPFTPRPQSLAELVCNAERSYLLNNKEEQVDGKQLEKKIVGFYFSAHWCPPCRGFTPELVSVYNELKEQNKPFEIVFISSDKSPEEFRQYHAEMPWLAIPFEERELAESLGVKFEVRGIPTLILFDEEGKKITSEGRQLIGSKGSAAYPFRPDAAAETKLRDAFQHELKALFTHLDADRDGKVTLQELSASLKKGGIIPNEAIEETASKIVSDISSSPFALEDWTNYFEEVSVINDGIWSLAYLKRLLGLIEK